MSLLVGLDDVAVLPTTINDVATSVLWLVSASEVGQRGSVGRRGHDLGRIFMSGDLAGGTIAHHFAGGTMSGPRGAEKGPHHKGGRGRHRTHLRLRRGQPCHTHLHDDGGGGRRRSMDGRKEEERQRGRRRNAGGREGGGALAGEKEEHRRWHVTPDGERNSAEPVGA